MVEKTYEQWEGTMRNTSLGSERTAQLLCVGNDTLRIQEREIPNTNNETKSILKV